VLVPYPSWLNAGDNSWQLVAATLVGLMSIPALAVLYAGLVQRKWAVNAMMMVFSAFCLTLIVWVLYAFKMGFGEPWISTFIGKPGTVLGHAAEQAQANIPLLNGFIPKFRFPQASLVYFQFVFAAITPILLLGSVLGRINFKVWLLFVPLWITFAYTVNAFLIWGGGWWGAHGTLDYSGGYVIHLAAGVSGFVAAAMVGPRLRRDRESGAPSNLPFVAVGAGLLWLGWNGFNGGDPYNAGADASSAVLNTNVATAVAFLVWVGCDYLTKRKPSLIGSVNGMIVGLVAITPAAGFVGSDDRRHAHVEVCVGLGLAVHAREHVAQAGKHIGTVDVDDTRARGDGDAATWPHGHDLAALDHHRAVCDVASGSAGDVDDRPAEQDQRRAAGHRSRGQQQRREDVLDHEGDHRRDESAGLPGTRLLGLHPSRLADSHGPFTLAQYEAREFGLRHSHRLASVLVNPVAHIPTGERAIDVLHKGLNHATRSACAHP
jgi:ammonium transporter